MDQYTVRAQKISAIGFLTQSDHYEDYEITTNETLEELAARLAAKGFLAPGSRRWIMPGAIIWIEPV